MLFCFLHGGIFRNCVKTWTAEKIKAQFYHMVRSFVVPAVSVGPRLTWRDVAMLFLDNRRNAMRQNINTSRLFNGRLYILLGYKEKNCNESFLLNVVWTLRDKHWPC